MPCTLPGDASLAGIGATRLCERDAKRPATMICSQVLDWWHRTWKMLPNKACSSCVLAVCHEAVSGAMDLSTKSLAYCSSIATKHWFPFCWCCCLGGCGSGRDSPAHANSSHLPPNARLPRVHCEGTGADLALHWSCCQCIAKCDTDAKVESAVRALT